MQCISTKLVECAFIYIKNKSLWPANWSFGDVFLLTGEPKSALQIFAFEALVRCTSVNLFLGMFAIFRKAILVSSCLSVLSSACPHGTTRLPLDGFSRNLIFEYFSKICLENSDFIKTCQE
jgi:hypothetical protein